MLGLYYNTVLMCVISTAICNAMPQHLFENGPFQNQKKHAIDFFSTRLVANPKVRRNYLDCFLDNGPCSPEAKNIKRMVPDAIKNECEHCTELQKRVIEKMMCYLNNQQPDILKQVAAKFDPNGEYMKQYIEKIENDQFLNPQLQSPKNIFQPQLPQPQDQDQNQQKPHQNNHHDQNQLHQGQKERDQNQNNNHHSQPNHQQSHQNHKPPSHQHPHQQPQNPNQQQSQNPHQQQPQNSHQQQPQKPHEQQLQNPHEQQPLNPNQQQSQNPHQQQTHHHHHPQQPQQTQQPVQR